MDLNTRSTHLVDASGARYARVIEQGTRIASIIMALGFLVYLTGMGGSSRVPPQELPRYWSLSAHDLLLATGGASGWNLFQSPMASEGYPMIGAMMLAGLSALASASVIPVFWRRRDRTHTVALVFHVLIVLFSASNLGHAIAARQHPPKTPVDPSQTHLRPPP